jgi:hypothetical protein
MHEAHSPIRTIEIPPARPQRSVAVAFGVHRRGRPQPPRGGPRAATAASGASR